jgi:hypothetical protein
LETGGSGVTETYSFCKATDIYVDSTSEMPLELGTKEFPYKELADAFLEVFSIINGSNQQVQILVKELTTNKLNKITNSAVMMISGGQVHLTTYCTTANDCTPGVATIMLKYTGTKKVHNTSIFSLMKDYSFDLPAKVAAFHITQEYADLLTTASPGAFIMIHNT